MKIQLKGVATFDEKGTELQTDKKINLVYGLNGTGKTTFSNFLKNQDDEKFKDCQIEEINDEKILVYNQKFIQENFYEKEQLNSIFTLSKENKEAEEKIKKATEEIKKLEEDKKTKTEEKEKKENEKNNNLENAKNTTWKIKTDDRLLQFCLEGKKGSRDSLFNHIKAVKKGDSEPPETIENLKEKIKYIEEEGAIKVAEVQLLNINLGDIENNTIFSEIIVGNENSTVAKLIKELQNTDWVKKGLDYLPQEIIENAQCPFCQEKTISQEVANNIKNYFDKTYEEKINQLKDLKIKYEQNAIPTKETFLSNKFIEKQKDKFENLYNALLTIINDNKKIIEEKIQNPSEEKQLQNSKEAIEKFNDFIKEINEKITEYNNAIDNKKSEKEKINTIFWQIMRWQYDYTISNYLKFEKQNKIDLKNINAEITKLIENINTQNQIIEVAQKETVNIEEAIGNINKNLKDIGINNFSITKHQSQNENHFYKIVREGQTENDFKTLSEGEKMMISFLYFIELCKGKESTTDTNDKKIIVIDDPISSLSHIYIYNVAQFIKQTFFEKENTNFEKIFVLTHSLYFFTELIKITNSPKLFRIVKNNYSEIKEMQEDEIQNDYQMYWQIVKDAQKNENENDNVKNPMLPNAIRNILENFFGFISKEKLKDAIEKIDNTKYGSFIRYINRESHSDNTNITDYNEINVNAFLEAFEKIFQESGYEEHYNKYLGK